MNGLQQPAGQQTAACWNSIGVRGNASCSELERHIHCRNCPIFAAGAVELLGIECPDDLLLEQTQLVGQSQATEELASRSLMVFRLGLEWLALSTQCMKEVASQRPTHSLPHRRSGMVRGLVNIRGELLVCVRLESILGTEQQSVGAAPDQRAAIERLLVLEKGSNRVVCAVSEVLGVHRFRQSEFKEIAVESSRVRKSYLRSSLNWRDRVIGVLDEGRLLQSIEENLSLVAKS